MAAALAGRRTCHQSRPTTVGQTQQHGAPEQFWAKTAGPAAAPKLANRWLVQDAAMAGSTAPLAVAGYTYDALPAAARDAVPTDAELATALGSPFTERAQLTADLDTDDQ